MNIVIYGKQTQQFSSATFTCIVKVAARYCRKIFVFNDLYKSVQINSFDVDLYPISNCIEVDETIDFFISIGGDGTFLDAVATLGKKNIPIIGINMGRLGFLSNVNMDKIEYLFINLQQGNYIVEKRMLLELQCPNRCTTSFALNDIVIHRLAYSGLITVDVTIDGQHLNSYWGDGVIIATPTGSTAYSFSCGGPIVYPNLEAFIITPIASHTMTVRPIVIPVGKMEIKVSGRDDKFVLSKDSENVELPVVDTIIVQKADFCVNIVRLNNQNFYDILNEKLMWGVDKRKLL